MSSIITDNDRHTLRQAWRRTRRYNLWAAIFFVALFGVLAVKAQVAPKPVDKAPEYARHFGGTLTGNAHNPLKIH